MEKERLRDLLQSVQAGQMDVDQALAQLKNLPYEDLGFAQLDLHRALRTGDPEVVFCPSKTNAQVAQIFKRLSQHHQRVMGTRATLEQAQAVQELLPEAVYDPLSRLIMLNRDEIIDFPPDYPYILVACAGTADLPVAEEAAQTAEFFGSRVQRAFDIGVAGIHRLFSKLDLVQNADVIISVAGMEGALTSVIGGLAACPVIGVPTSVGYGASFNGLAALLAMLNSCSPGVAVVNIDNGFGAGLYANTIMKRIIKVQPK
ncbi:MAG TPA: nickel pincer cofactor biosynthesis protein LarB [Anaerolineales bacterium]|nr:nickel pincer cofactor biosynthesis protein LarB [Anaerolineales bacterium]